MHFTAFEILKEKEMENCMDYFPINNVKLASVQKDSWEGQITEEELLHALRGPLLACFNHSYKNGRLSDT